MEQSTVPTQQGTYYGDQPASEDPPYDRPVTIIRLAGGDTIETATSRETVLGALTNVLKEGGLFVWVDPPRYDAPTSDEQIVVRADQIVSLAVVRRV